MGNKTIKPQPQRQERVYELMNRENLSQKDLAEKMGIKHQQRVSEFLKSGKISDYYMEKIKTAFPNYLPEWLDGYGDPAIATKEDQAVHNWLSHEVPEEDLTNYFNAVDSTELQNQLIEKLNLLDPVHRIEVLELLNRIVEPYTMIPEWERI